MLNKKGFTLIELLAVIVILAIIAIIAVPQIADVIENVRESAFKSSVQKIKEAGEYTLATGEHNIGDDIDVSTLDYKGKRYDIGSMHVNEEGQIEVSIWNGEIGKCAVITGSSNEVTFDDTKDETTCGVITPTRLDLVVGDSEYACYTFDSASQTLNEYDFTNCSGNIVIPTSVDGVDVKIIGTGFAQIGASGEEIKSLDFSHALEVETIGMFAFNNSLQHSSTVVPMVDLSNMTKLTSIGMSAFNTTKINNLVLSDSLVTIGGSSFADTGISSIEIPNSVTTIENYAFTNNPLTTVTIDNSSANVTLGTDAFGTNFPTWLR